MAALITRLRVFIEDPAGAQAQYTDDELQANLDTNRVRLADVCTAYDVLRLEFASPYPNLEGDATVRVANGGALLTPTSVNYDAGTFTFAVAQDDTPHVWGYAYDLHAAAAELWTSKAGRTKNWQGQFGMLAQQQIKYHRSLSWSHATATSRSVEDLYGSRYGRYF